MTGFVYALRCDGAVKIGYAADPLRRMSELNTGSHHQYELVGYASGSMAHERELQALCAEHRIRGEWFREEGVVSLFLQLLPQKRVDVSANAAPECGGIAEPLTSVELVIDILGGSRSIADLLGVTVNAVSNWRVSNIMPAYTYLVVSDALAARGMIADVSVWNFIKITGAAQ